jgi:hypothetical protein
MGFGHCPRRLDHWMVIEFFLLLMIKFGKGACNVLENFLQVLLLVIRN